MGVRIPLDAPNSQQLGDMCDYGDNQSYYDGCMPVGIVL